MQSRNWQWTLDAEYVDDASLDEIVDSVDEHYNYIIAGDEVGEKNGRRHFQGFIQFPRVMRWTTVKKLFPWDEVHIGDCCGRYSYVPDKAIEYCKKDGLFIERGEYRDGSAEAAGDGERKRWKSAYDDTKEGNIFGLIDRDPSMLRYYGTLKSFARDYFWHIYKPEALKVLDNYWYFGGAGRGKTKMVLEKEGNKLYQITGTIHRFSFSNYDPRKHESILFNDIRRENIESCLCELKNLSEHKPYQMELKGGDFVQIRPLRVYVTSKYRMKEIVPGEHLEEFERRFKEVEFKSIT